MQENAPKPKSRFGSLKMWIWIGAWILGINLFVTFAFSGRGIRDVEDLERVLGETARTIGAESDGRLVQYQFAIIKGDTVMRLVTVEGIEEASGQDLACNVVRPVLALSRTQPDSWEVVTPEGTIIATQDTDCP